MSWWHRLVGDLSKLHEKINIPYVRMHAVFATLCFIYFLDYENEDPRILGLAMIPGKHIVSLEIDEQPASEGDKKTLNETNDSSPQMEPLPDL